MGILFKIDRVMLETEDGSRLMFQDLFNKVEKLEKEVSRLQAQSAVY